MADFLDKIVKFSWKGWQLLGKCYHFFKRICQFLQENFTFFAGKLTIFQANWKTKVSIRRYWYQKKVSLSIDTSPITIFNEFFLLQENILNNSLFQYWYILFHWYTMVFSKVSFAISVLFVIQCSKTQSMWEFSIRFCDHTINNFMLAWY